MRRRTVLLTLPLGALALGACDDGAPEPDPESDPTGAPDVAVDPTPTRIGERAETVDVTTLRLPLEMIVMIVVDPGWNAAPLELDGTFLGYDDSGDRLRFTAVDQDGTTLWTAQRPLDCTGYALSREPEGRAVAVLADTTAGNDGEPATTVTGYDLRTAEELWGPTEVPGPQAAPGLVFAPPTEGGARIALSAGTGQRLLGDAEIGRGRLLAEHAGTILHTDGAELVARSGPDTAELWRTDLPTGLAPETARIVGSIEASTSLAVLGDGEEPGILLDISDGRVVAEDVSGAAHDHGLDVTVVAAGHTVRGLDAEGEETWRHEDPEALVFLTAGERLAYAQRPEEGTLVVLDTSRGRMIQPYDTDRSGPLAVPELYSVDAATSVYVEDTRYLVTTTLDENYGLRE